VAQPHEITESQLIAALQEARAEARTPDGALTTQELAEELNWSGAKVRKRLRALKAAGQLEIVRVVRENLAGAEQPLPGYRILDKSTEATE